MYRWLITFCATAATESGELLLPTERGTRALLGMDDEDVLVDEDDEDELMEDIWDMTRSMGSIEIPRVAVMSEDADPAPSMAMSFAFPVDPVSDGLAALSLKIALALLFDSLEEGEEEEDGEDVLCQHGLLGRIDHKECINKTQRSKNGTFPATAMSCWAIASGQWQRIRAGRGWCRARRRRCG